MTLFYIPNPTQYLTLISILQTIKKQQLAFWGKSHSQEIDQ